MKFNYQCYLCGTLFAAAVEMVADEFGLIEAKHEMPPGIKMVAEKKNMYAFRCCEVE